MVCYIASEEICETKGGYGPCKFPFTYKNETFRACTEAGGYEGKPWCAYEVKADGVFKKWGYCDKNCVTRISAGIYYGHWYLLNENVNLCLEL